MPRGDDGSLEAEASTPKDKATSKQRGIQDAVILASLETNASYVSIHTR